MQKKQVQTAGAVVIIALFLLLCGLLFLIRGPADSTGRTPSDSGIVKQRIINLNKNSD